VSRKVLVTGGAGYIGSTIASACLDAGISPVVLDDLSTGRAEFAAGRPFYRGDIADADLIRRIAQDHPEIEVVVHCAARIIVPESVSEPLAYYDNNVARTVAMLCALKDVGLDSIVFSSSASIYAPTTDFAVDETSPFGPMSPYATAKAIVENILADVSAAGGLRAISLRYFNPVGADPQLRSGLQNPMPTHALGKLIEADRDGVPFTITGTDWPTRDGTGLRDYVHVWDLARAHVASVRMIDQITRAHPHVAINLGTGTGTTVRELVDAFGRVTGRPIAVREAPRRPGDSAGCYTRSDHAAELLGWRAELSLEASITDSLRWAEQMLPGLTSAGEKGQRQQL
jgi:UDP-glucose 4-epimerase